MDPLLKAGGAAWPLEAVAPSPCRVACPAGVDVKAYVGLIAAGRFERALEVVRWRNPLPGICGRVCTHPCEAGCNRCEVDEPVAICALKRAIADFELAAAASGTAKPLTPRFPPSGRRVAVVGSGPAGLTVASDLALAGVAVTLFEALPEAGGMLRYGIPAFRLPPDILDAEIDAVRALGVDLRTGKRVGDRGRPLKRLLGEYDAVFLAVGAHRGIRLGLPGEEDAEGVFDAIDWFRRLKMGEDIPSGRDVVVVGGGNSAVDAARVSLRRGASRVTIAYRRSREEMPADPLEVHETEEEGVQIRFLAGPVRIDTEKGKVKALVCQRMELGEPDASGRRRPVPVPGSEFSLPADTLIAAVSQRPVLDFLGNAGVEVRRDRIHADESDQATSVENVFAGGDAVTGPATVIEAIAAGHRASDAILRHLDLEERIPPQRPSGPERGVATGARERARAPRRAVPVRPAEQRRRDFSEVNRPYAREEAMAEAARCMRCGPCSECVECVNPCDHRLALLRPVDRDGAAGQIVRISKLCEETARKEGGTVFVTAEEDGGERKLEPVVARIEPALCRACGRCIEACPVGAVRLLDETREARRAVVDGGACRSCGACAAVCITGAASLPGFTDRELLERLNRE